MARFFDETWVFWWLFALVAILRWYWINLGPGARSNDDGKPWRELYRAAVLERDLSKVAVRIEEAEGTILHEMSAQPFGDHDPEQRALQDAMNNLQALRESAELGKQTPPRTRDLHRSTTRSRPQHWWKSSGSLH
jgi:hypothetical protein